MKGVRKISGMVNWDMVEELVEEERRYTWGQSKEIMNHEKSINFHDELLV